MVVLGVPYNCRSRRAARGPGAPVNSRQGVADLARSHTGKRVSEAGSRRLSRDTSGGPTSHAASASELRGGWDLSVEGTSDLESLGVGAPGVERVLGSRRWASARAGARRRARQGVFATQPFGSHEAQQARCGCTVWRMRAQAAPSGASRMVMVAAGGRGAKPRHHSSRRCRLRLAGASVDALVPKLVQACGWKGGVGSAGRESVSQPIES